jgi:NAD(P)-dependent dehydrogenase (short-subunit alcohol dehydrogenase family)
MMSRLKDKVAIVTGASSGFGRAIAKAFAEEGAKLVCSDLRAAAREDGFEGDIIIPTDEAIRKSGYEATFMKCDVSKVLEVKALVDVTAEKYGKLDIMVANAGVFAGLGRIHENTEEQYDFTMSVNSKGVWNADQQAIIQFLKQGKGGKVINMISIGGLVGLPNEAAYCASKGAVANLTRQLAVDYGRNGITVNGICPNFAATGMSRLAYEDKEMKTFVEGLTPLGRWATSEDVAKLAVFLASGDADYITGALIPVDGGYIAK